MASLKKFTNGAVLNQLRHNERTLENPSNEDIDPERSGDNYALFTPKEGSCYDRYLERKEDLKHEDFSEKICANDVLNLNEFKHFHPDLQHYLTAEGFDCCVHSGITREIGGNLTVDELKHREEYLHKKGYNQGVQW